MNYNLKLNNYQGNTNKQKLNKSKIKQIYKINLNIKIQNVFQYFKLIN